ncbi:GntR family transcriptional regulator [Fusobacterium sp.]|uniref:GntR family transcriptional regulator n=1 Tax=Fusobacterium sp. TaxID=68766 RepID=UPI002633E04E|nr:GntR family transcriptional regulator [Fusobacterium sp.]
MDFKITEKIKGESSKQYTYRILKDSIMNLSLKPGEALSEIEISQALNVSRTPVREAIVKLKEEKLINVFPQKGSLVSKMNLKLIEEAVFLRKICDKEMLKMVCSRKNNDSLIKELRKNLEYQKIIVEFEEDIYEFFRLDNKFHEIIYEFCNKLNIWKAIKKLSTHYDRLRLFDVIEKKNLRDILVQHEKIIDILEKNSFESIDDMVTEHLFNFKEMLGIFIEKCPNYFEK